MLQNYLSPQDYLSAKAEKLTLLAGANQTLWPTQYRNSETGRLYVPHSNEERDFVYHYTVPFPAILGGEGSGKSVAGIIADLERVRDLQSGIVVSPNLPHFRRSLWPEFRRWCPWQCVVSSQQYRESPEWVPHEQFELVFNLRGYPRLLMGGLIGESGRVGSWEGPNVSFFHIDEARHLHSAQGLKVLVGRVRIPSPSGWLPQGYITSTGGSDVITEYYGPLKDDDPQSDYKSRTSVIILLTENNLHNLSSDYLDNRSSILNDAEREILLGHDPFSVIEDSPLLDNIVLWDRLKEPLPALTKREPLVLALDAGKNRDHFGMVGTTRHPDKARHRAGDVAVRFSQEWIPPKRGKGLDFSAGPLARLRELNKLYNIVCVPYDPWQLHQPMLDLERELGLYVKEFTQGDKRAIADSDLVNGIVNGTLAHNGELFDLRKHIMGARRKPDPANNGRIRIIKKNSGTFVDLTVCLSMSTYMCKFLNL